MSKDIEEDTRTDPWVLYSKSLPYEERLRATVANGYIGTIVYHGNIHVSGVYNGKANATTYNDTSTHCRVPNQIASRLGIPANVTVSDHSYELRVHDGIFIETILTSDWLIELRQYAHQIYKTLFVVEVEGKPRSRSPSTLTITLNKLTLNESEIDDMQIIDRDHITGKSLIKYHPLIQEDDSIASPNLTVAWTNVPESLTFSKHNHNVRTFLMASVVNCANDVAYADLDKGIVAAENGSLYTHHINAWHDLWDHGGRFDIRGNDDLAQIVHSGFYYILSSSPTDPYDQDAVHGWPNFGLSPAGLAHSDKENEHYWGHIFWDQETWMLPALAPFYPNIIKRILQDTRIRRLEQARGKAEQMDFKGAMFPWEVGYSGYETTNWEPAAFREIHISGDIAQFARQYLYWTNDIDFLRNGAYTLFYDIAEFWASRLSWLDERNLYGAVDAMGPDEHNDHVNNSIYTNAIGAVCLNIPQEFYGLLEDSNESFLPPNSNWSRIADKVYVPFDEELQYHPEFEGYKNGTLIKQADVVLLGYPLLFNMSEMVRKNDLAIYEKVTSPKGPAMTWSIHSIGWLDLREPDHAYRLFEKNFRNIHGPFKIWTENAQGDGAVNFITGIGGFLQNLLYGYLGLRVLSDRLDFYPKIIPNTTGYSVSNVKYLGLRLNFSIDEETVKVDVKNDTASCDLYTYSTGVHAPLCMSCTLPLGKYGILCKK